MVTNSPIRIDRSHAVSASMRPLRVSNRLEMPRISILGGMSCMGVPSPLPSRVSVLAFRISLVAFVRSCPGEELAMPALQRGVEEGGNNADADHPNENGGGGEAGLALNNEVPQALVAHHKFGTDESHPAVPEPNSDTGEGGGRGHGGDHPDQCLKGSGAEAPGRFE